MHGLVNGGGIITIESASKRYRELGPLEEG